MNHQHIDINILDHKLDRKHEGISEADACVCAGANAGASGLTFGGVTGRKSAAQRIMRRTIPGLGSRYQSNFFKEQIKWIGVLSPPDRTLTTQVSVRSGGDSRSVRHRLSTRFQSRRSALSQMSFFGLSNFLSVSYRPRPWVVPTNVQPEAR